MFKFKIHLQAQYRHCVKREMVVFLKFFYVWFFFVAKMVSIDGKNKISISDNRRKSIIYYLVVVSWENDTSSLIGLLLGLDHFIIANMLNQRQLYDDIIFYHFSEFIYVKIWINYFLFPSRESFSLGKANALGKSGCFSRLGLREKIG